MAIATQAEKYSGDKRTTRCPVYVYEDSVPPVAFTLSERVNSLLPAAITAANALTGKTWNTAFDDYSGEMLSDHSFRFEINYNEREYEGGGGLPPPSFLPGGTLEHTFSFQAQPKLLSLGLADIQQAGPSGNASGLVLSTRGNGFEAKRIRIDPPAVTDTLTYVKPVNAGENLLTAYINDLRTAIGCYNSDTFQGAVAGTVFLAAIQGTRRTTGEYNLSFGFAFGSKRSQTAGSGGEALTLTDVLPFSHVRYDEKRTWKAAAGTGRIVAAPQMMYEIRVWPTAALTTLLALP